MNIRIFFWKWVCVFLLLPSLCIGCGEKNGQREYGIEGYIYKGEWISLPGYNADTDDRILKMKVYEDYLYYVQGRKLFRMHLKDGIGLEEAAEYIFDCSASTETIIESMADYEVYKDGGIYLAMKVSRKTGKWGVNSEEAGCAVVRRLADGTESYHVYLPEVYVEDGFCLTVGNGGDVFLLTSEGIYRVDPEGNVSGSIATSAYKGGGMEDFLLKGAGDRIYYCVGLMRNSCSFHELVYGDEIRLESRGGTPEGERCNGFFPSKYGLLCDTDNGLYQYREESGWGKILQWWETGILHDGSGFCDLVQIDREAFIGMGASSVTYDVKPCLLKREAVPEQPEREDVVVASVYPGDTLRQAVVEFNQASDKYRVVVESYERHEVEMGLNPRLVSSDPPDILDASLLDIMNYAEKKTFEDLAPYLEESGALDSDMFLEGVLEGYTIDGRLVCIPGSFKIKAVAGRASQLGDRMGWTMEDVMELAGRYPDQRISLYDSAQFLIKELCSRYICERYIDWGTGECRFDGEEFCRFLEWVGDNSERVMSDYSYREEYWNKERLVEKDTGSGIRCCAKMEILFGEDVTFIGDLTEDGRAVFQAQPWNALCMVASSRHKEGAWAFIEYMLSRDDLNAEYGYFPSHRGLLERVIEEEMTPEYHRSEDGEIVFWQGEPSEKIKGGYNGVHVYSMTQEEADTLWRVVEAVDFRPMGGVRDKVTDIILEELESYMDGTRSVEDVARIIQNRVRTLVQEKG